MGGDDEGRGGARLRAECLEYVREEPEDLVAGLRVERARRLIGDDEWGAGQDGECDGGPLRLAAGELGGPATRESRIRQPHASEDLRDARGIRAGDGAQLAAQAHQGVQGLDPPLRDEAHAADPGDDALAGQCESRGEPPADTDSRSVFPDPDGPRTTMRSPAEISRCGTSSSGRATPGACTRTPTRVSTAASIAVIGPSRSSPVIDYHYQ